MAIRVPISADVSKFQSDMKNTSAIAGTAVRQITSRVIEMNAGLLASQGAVGGATLAFGRFLPVVGQVLLGVTAVIDTFKLMSYATELAKVKIAEFNDIAAKANASGFSTDFFQRITKSGGEARDKIDDITAALKRFNDASTGKLGGSDVQQRIDALTKAGNFTGNTGASALGGANDAEGRLRAVVSLIDQAMQKGERLAAIDLAGTAFGPSVASALQKDSGYLDDMLKRADAMNKSKIISPEDVGRAIELKERMDAAQLTLANKWKPIQDDLAKLGMNYHESWVNITEDLAAAVGYATQLYTALNKVPDWFAKKIGGASIWDSITNATTTPESRAASEASLGISSDPKDIGMVAANNSLRAALQNHANVTQAMQQATGVQSAVRGDTSKNPTGAAGADANDAFDRASESIAKHTARLEADTESVGKGAAATEELRAQAQLLTAAQAAGLPVTQAMRDKIQDLAQDAGDAADKLAKARVATDISFGSQTAFLTPEDVQIAKQLAGIYGNDVPAALASSEAAALRFNNALKTVGTLSQDVTRGFAVDFETAIRNGSTAGQAALSALSNALGKVADKLTSMAVDSLWSKAFGGSSGTGLLGNLFGGGSAASATAGATWSSGLGAGTGGLSFPMFAGGTDSAPGGLSIVGEKGPELVNLPRGSQVVPNNKLGSMGGGDVHVPIQVNIDATGADAAGLARVEQKLADLKANIPGLTVQAVKSAQKRRLL